tara:strand:- start:266 stop:400 length:135 start_codon:yes stop_codon:yes gene_type:complete
MEYSLLLITAAVENKLLTLLNQHHRLSLLDARQALLCNDYLFLM